ncbi:MAG: hypothetical protein EGP81_03805 [Bacteroides clarus]|nr:hypothetical protein [Bacteroides clarus]
MKNDKIYILIIFNGIRGHKISGSAYFCFLNKKKIYEKIAERDNTIAFDVYGAGIGVLYE